MSLFVLFVSLIFGVSAWDGNCPEHVETMPEFKPEFYLGDWYTIYTSYNSYIDGTTTCVRASYKKLSMISMVQLSYLFSEKFTLPTFNFHLDK